MTYIIQAPGGMRAYWDGQTWDDLDHARRYANIADLPTRIGKQDRVDRPGKMPIYGHLAVVKQIPDINQLIF